MKKRFCRMLALLCVLLVTAGVPLFAKAGSEAGTGQAVGKPVLKYLIHYEPGIELTSATESIVLWGEKVGVKFEIISPPRDNFAEKVSIALASGDMPDMIMFFRDKESHRKYGPQLFVPIDTAMKDGKLPNVKKWFDKYPITYDTLVAGDGHVYGFPGFVDAVWPSYMMWARGDLMLKGGVDPSKVDTLDDLKRGLLAVKNNAGHDYIIFNRNGVANYFGYAMPHFGITQDVYFDDDPGGTKRYVFSVDLPRFKTFVEFSKWLVDNKVMYPDWATMTGDDLDSFYSQKMVKFAFDAPNGYTDFDQRFLSDLPAGAMAARILPPKIDGKRYAIRKSSPVSYGFRYPIVISKASKAVDAALRAIDWLYSDEGSMQMQYGPRGRWWDYDKSYPGGIKFNVQQAIKDELIIDQVDQWAAKNGKTMEELYPNGNKESLSWGYGPYTNPITTNAMRMFLTPFLPDQKDLAAIVPDSIDFYVKNGAVKEPEPIVVFTQDEIDQLVSLRTALNTFVQENVQQFINGVKPLSQWADFTAGCKRLGSDKLVALFNAAYDRKTKK
jgi:putative aldouronate transport system substrate-binding protein